MPDTRGYVHVHILQPQEYDAVHIENRGIHFRLHETSIDLLAHLCWENISTVPPNVAIKQSDDFKVERSGLGTDIQLSWAEFIYSFFELKDEQYTVRLCDSYGWVNILFAIKSKYNRKPVEADTACESTSEKLGIQILKPSSRVSSPSSKKPNRVPKEKVLEKLKAAPAIMNVHEGEEISCYEIDFFVTPSTNHQIVPGLYGNWNTGTNG